MNEKAIEINKESIEHWRDQKFGMFIHWGLFALHGQGCWGMWLNQTDKDEYARLADSFTAKKFDADAWASLAKEAGMKYMVLTAKHHDGFSLWDSKACLDDFTSVNSAAKRDFVKEYTDSCRKAGLMTGLYYSPLDWRFPGFFMPKIHKKSADALVEQAHKQTEELVSNYGKIDLLWFDGSLKDLTNVITIDEIRALQPQIVVNDRLWGWGIGDYCSQYECHLPKEDPGMPWETCQIWHVGGGWSYVKNADKYRALDITLNQYETCKKWGGNLLLNIAPAADGSVPEAYYTAVKEFGEAIKNG